MSEHDKCPRCSAKVFTPTLPPKARSALYRTQFECGSYVPSDGEARQSDTCRIAELTAQLAALASAAKDAHHLLTGYHHGYIGLNADGNVLFTQFDVACAGHALGEAIAALSSETEKQE